METGERMGRIEERVVALERDTGGLRSEIHSLRIELGTRYEATRSHIDSGLQRVMETVRADLAAHMEREEQDQSTIRNTLIKVERWRWSTMTAVGLLAWALGIATAFKWH